MIVAQVLFSLPEPLAPEAARSYIESTIPHWKQTEGMIRKYFVASEDGREVGGVYLWESREAADAVYTDEWQRRVTRAFGAAPRITYWDCTAVLDNRFGEVVKPQRAEA